MGKHTARDCVGAMGPVTQAGCNCVGAWLSLVLFACVFDRKGLARLGLDVTNTLFWARVQATVAVTVTIVLAAILAVLVIMDGSFSSNKVKAYGNIVNVILCITTATHWLLQIRETWILRGLGSLSAIVVIVGSTGSVLTGVTYLAHGAIGTALSQFICAVMMGAVLVVSRVRQAAAGELSCGDQLVIVPESSAS